MQTAEHEAPPPERVSPLPAALAHEDGADPVDVGAAEAPTTAPVALGPKPERPRIDLEAAASGVNGLNHLSDDAWNAWTGDNREAVDLYMDHETTRAGSGDARRLPGWRPPGGRRDETP